MSGVLQVPLAPPCSRPRQKSLQKRKTIAWVVSDGFINVRTEDGQQNAMAAHKIVVSIFVLVFLKVDRGRYRNRSEGTGRGNEMGVASSDRYVLVN